MRTHTKKILALTVVLAAVAWLPACNGTYDDEPNVVLEVKTLTITPITGQTDTVTGQCTFTITNATASFDNKPKNALATESPANDIILQSVDVTYIWDDGAGVAAATFGVGGTVTANGSGTSQFAVVNLQDLNNPPREGHTARLILTFHGVTASGDPVSATTGGSLSVNSCPPSPPPTGACCFGTACSVVTEAQCNIDLGVYRGDNTICGVNTCP
jgi:hypothetical protein